MRHVLAMLLVAGMFLGGIIAWNGAETAVGSFQGFLVFLASILAAGILDLTVEVVSLREHFEREKAAKMPAVEAEESVRQSGKIAEFARERGTAKKPSRSISISPNAVAAFDDAIDEALGKQPQGPLR